MSKLKGLLLTEGMHGMISQVEGLAKALELDFFHEKIELNSFWKYFPPKFTPVKKFVFKNIIEKDFDVIISCGRKSVIPSIFFKKSSKKKIFNIHIQNPKVSLKNFDFVLVPEHDNLQGKNVISTKGALHYLTMQEIDENRSYLEGKINKKKDIIIFVDANEKKIRTKLKKRPNFNIKIFTILKKLQLPLKVKKKKSNFIIKNNFKSNYVKKNVNNILKKI